MAFAEESARSSATDVKEESAMDEFGPIGLNFGVEAFRGGDFRG